MHFQEIFRAYDQRAIESILSQGFVKELECDNGCQATKNLKQCTRCQDVRYCSEECQRSAWKIHNSTCKKADSFYLKEDGKIHEVKEYTPIAKYLPLIERSGNCHPQYVVPYYLRVGLNKEELENCHKYMYENDTRKRSIVFVSQKCDLEGVTGNYHYKLDLVPCLAKKAIFSIFDPVTGNFVDNL
jgi:hypothetical protein